MNSTNLKSKNNCSINYYVLLEMMIIVFTLIIYFSINSFSQSFLTGDMASTVFYLIILVILFIGFKKSDRLSVISEQSIPYYLVANVLVLLYIVVSFLSKIALFIDQWLNGIPTSFQFLVYPIDIFFFSGLIIALFLPLIYNQSKKQLGVK